MSNDVHINAGLVQRLVAEQFPVWADLPITPVQNSGWDNRTFHLGSEMSVRLPSAQHYAAAVDREQTWLPRLAPKLPLPIPKPMAQGQPSDEYPWQWSIYKWLPGEIASTHNIRNMDEFAGALAKFLKTLQKNDVSGGPVRTLRGGSLAIWDKQARAAIDALRGKIDTKAATAIWDDAVHAPFLLKPVWFHGDIAAGNLLVQEGELCAVIDFGDMGVGDPGCDMAIAWTMFDQSSRDIFRSELSVSDEVWARGCGWALWKAMIVLAELIETNAVETASAPYTIGEIINEHRQRTVI